MSEHETVFACRRGRTPQLVNNMSAPPRSTVSFRPYGLAESTPNAPAPAEKTCGLQWLLRADPDALLQATLPSVGRLITELRHEALSLLPGNAAGAMHVAKIRSLRIRGLVSLTAHLAGEDPGLDDFASEAQPLELLQDRLIDLASRLPRPPAGLPALAIAESLAGGGARSDPGSTDTLAVLWVLTRINGRTFDRQGLPHLPADIADGGTYDLYVPCTKELP